MYLIPRNLITAGMISMLISHGIIQFCVFELFQVHSRADIASKIIRGIPSHKQVILGFDRQELIGSVTGFRWIDENEFRYQGRMYDIISKEERGDSVYLYCIEDSAESDLYAVLDKIIENDSEDPDEQKALNNFFSQFYSSQEIYISFLNPQPDSFYQENCVDDLLEGVYLLTTPPPRA